MSSVKKFGNSDMAEPKRNIFISVLINTYIQAIICECFVSNRPHAWAFWFMLWALWPFSDTWLYDDLLKQLLRINSRRWNTFLSEYIYIMGDIHNFLLKYINIWHLPIMFVCRLYNNSLRAQRFHKFKKLRTKSCVASIDVMHIQMKYQNQE